MLYGTIGDLKDCSWDFQNIRTELQNPVDLCIPNILVSCEMATYKGCYLNHFSCLLSLHNGY